MSYPSVNIRSGLNIIENDTISAIPAAIPAITEIRLPSLIEPA
jgi:hypothetical protein